MDTESLRVIAVDPGLATGECVLSWDRESEPKLEWADILDMKSYIYPIRKELAEHPDITVVCERFQITIATAKKASHGESLRRIGDLERAMWDAGREIEEIVLQSPNDAKNLFPDAALHTLGFWVPGSKDHARDAVRHGLLYLVRHGWKPTKLLSS